MCPSSGELLYQCNIWFMSLCVDDRVVCKLTCLTKVSVNPDGLNNLYDILKFFQRVKQWSMEEVYWSCGETKINFNLPAGICFPDCNNVHSHHTGTAFTVLSLAHFSTAVCRTVFMTTTGTHHSIQKMKSLCHSIRSVPSSYSNTPHQWRKWGIGAMVVVAAGGRRQGTTKSSE